MIVLCGLWLAPSTAVAQLESQSDGTGAHPPGAMAQESWSAADRAAESRATDALLGEVVAWLAGNFDLPAAVEQPRIALLPADEMASARFRILLQRQRPQSAAAGQPDLGRQAMRQIAAFYDEATRTIYLPETWQSTDPVQMSILVHEVVHHLQHMAGLRYACAQAREQLAFAAQEKWLALSGMDLESAFRMTRLTLLLRTRCLH